MWRIIIIGIFEADASCAEDEEVADENQREISAFSRQL
jgi:hypothetical protein